MKVAIVDYGSGNLHSALKAFERAAREAEISAEVRVTADPAFVLAADRVVLPGVGAFADCRRGLDSVRGMVEAIDESVRRRGRPFLGICVGMQLLATRGQEHETMAGLDWIPGDVAVIRPSDPALKIPHMGWNTLDIRRPHTLLDGVRAGLHAYFVHSFQLYAAERRRRCRDRRLRRPDHGARRARQCRGHAVPPRKEPDVGSRPDRQFPEMAPVILFPAIDLKNGECVRLVRGDMEQATVFNTDPAAQAQSFERQGFGYLHVVDLDGAFAGKPVNAAAVERILAVTGMKVQLGGGVRDLRTVAGWLEKGVSARHHRHRGAEGPRFRARGGAALSRPRRGGDRRARRAGSRSRAGRASPTSPRSTSAGCSRIPASRRSSTPTSPATASLQGLNIPQTVALAEALVDPRHRLGRPRLDRRRASGSWSPIAQGSPGRSPAARSTTAGSTPPRRWRC